VGRQISDQTVGNILKAHGITGGERIPLSPEQRGQQRQHHSISIP
jgi:hypothetical protein